MKKIIPNQSEHNPVHKKYMRIVLPIYGIISLSAIIAVLVLGYIDDQKYIVPIAILIGILAVTIFGTVSTMPLMRKKAIEEDLKRYDFDISTAEDKDEYRFEQRYMIESFVMSTGPFSDIDTAPFLLKGNDKLEEYLNSVDTKIIALNEIQPAYYDNQLTVTKSEDNYNFYEVLQTPLGDNIKVDIFLINEVVFNKDGISLNGIGFPYEKFNARLCGYVSKMRVFLKAEFAMEDLNEDDEKFLFIHLKFDKNVLKVMNRFGLTFENQYVADKIFSDVPKAFNQILKCNYFNKLEKEHLKQTKKQ